MLSERAKYKLWKRLDRQRQPHIRRALPWIRKALNEQLSFFLENFDELNPQLVDDFLRVDPIRKVYERIYMSVALVFARQTLEDNGKGLKQGTGNFEVDIQNYVSRNIIDRINGVRNRGAKILKEEILKGVTEELDVDTVASNIRKRWRNVGRARSRAIAQTEITTASNFGQMLGAESSQTSPVKSWLSSRDARVRRGTFDHLVAENENVNIPLSEAFFVSGERLEFPGDPSGSSGNVVGCRCGVLYIPQTPRFRPVVV